MTRPAKGTTTIGPLLQWGIDALTPMFATPRLEAEVLLAHVTQQPRHRPYAAPHAHISATETARYAALVERRGAGEPVAYLTGRREFWSLDLEVSPDTLIPRPETEHLVEAALVRLPQPSTVRVADLGTGSGAVALALAHERPRWACTATDLCAGALAVAQKNAKRLGVARIDFRLGDWCAALHGERYDLIVSNPPYVAEDDSVLRRGGLQFEPRRALAAGRDGLDALSRIAHEARSYLNPGGWLILEHGCTQGEPLRALLAALGYLRITQRHDYAGLERVVEALWQPHRVASS